MSDRPHRSTSYDPAAAGWEHCQLTPFTLHAGPIWRRRSGDSYVSGLLVEEHHCNRLGLLHGGALLTFVDHAVGIAAAWLLPDTPIVTLQLSTQFVSAARAGDMLVGRANVVRATASVVFVRGTISVDERIVAIADGVWKRVRPLADQAEIAARTPGR